MSILRRLSIAADIWKLQGFVKALLHLRGHWSQWRSKRQFRWARRRLAGQGECIRHVLGSKMYLDPGLPGIEAELLIYGMREAAATAYLMRILEPDDVILEAGANIGYYTLLCARLCKRVLAIEPHPENFHRLQRNLALNGVKNVELFPCAVGPDEQRVKLYCAETSNCHTRLPGGASKRSSIEVDEIRIDRLVSDQESPTFLRMDIEGYEHLALRGASCTLSAVRAVFLELHCTRLEPEAIKDTLRLLEDAGLLPVMIIQFDHPGVSAIHGPEKINDILNGERSTFEIFFERNH